MIKVLVADDHFAIREGLSLLIAGEADMRCVAQAADGAEAVRKASQTSPDVVVMDVLMPTLDGLAAARLIRRDAPGAKVVILSVLEGAVDIRASYAAGASAHLVKDIPAAQILDVIRRLDHGTGPAVSRGAH